MEENVIQINSVSVDVSVENVMYVKKVYAWNPSIGNCENRKTQQALWMIQRLCGMKLQSHMRKKQTLMKKEVTCNMQSFYILLAF